ncbi:MAG: 16S rRNA (guanine(966)-N(2))-methyltransferase RsmD [Candidatus Brocadiaceae bacterium]|nr:16S rRNA (guanine(966)-N(2))-methyltransferase RsmD [Candidatus Brocadiaceae bacterium]
MRVIAGCAKGKYLNSPKGNSTRPIKNRIKESLFNILSGEIPGSSILDLYAGSGAVGIEALSRGAKSCIFVEKERSAIQVIKRNLESTGLQEKANIIQGDVLGIFPFLEKKGITVNLLLACPPYPLIEKSSYRDKLLIFFSLLSRERIVQPDGTMMLQQKTVLFDIPPEATSLELFDTRVYGDTQLSFFRTQIRRGNVS